jgi:hypothetical protein
MPDNATAARPENQTSRHKRYRIDNSGMAEEKGMAQKLA